MSLEWKHVLLYVVQHLNKIKKKFIKQENTSNLIAAQYLFIQNTKYKCKYED